MRHPFQYCATKYCCFCLVFGPKINCYVIAVTCITINAFSGMTNFGIGHWSLYFFSILNFLLHLVAGVVLFLGTIWGKPGFKLAYCWLVFLGIFTVVMGIILYFLYHDSSYVIWDSTNRTIGIVLVSFHAVWLLAWDIYTPMVVLGNMFKKTESVDDWRGSATMRRIKNIPVTKVEAKESAGSSAAVEATSQRPQEGPVRNRRNLGINVLTFDNQAIEKAEGNTNIQNLYRITLRKDTLMSIKPNPSFF